MASNGVNKILIGIVALLIAVIGYWYWSDGKGWDTGSTKTTDASEFSWHFTDVTTEEVSPMTQAMLEVNGKTYDVGTYAGSCSTIESSAWTLESGEVSGIICWWAGGGNEVGVFKSGDTFVVMKGDLDEGNAEIAGFRGNFKLLFQLP